MEWTLVGQSRSSLRQRDNVAASLQIRVQDGDVVEVPAHRATHELLRSAMPFRPFRCYYGQRHYPGSYWSATMSSHVIYESRLELSRLAISRVARAMAIRDRKNRVPRSSSCSERPHTIDRADSY